MALKEQEAKIAEEARLRQEEMAKKKEDKVHQCNINYYDINISNLSQLEYT